MNATDGATAPTYEYPGDEQLLAALTESDANLLAQGLRALRERKVEALQIIQSSEWKMYGQSVHERDFGIPQIDELLRRLGEG